MKKKVYREKYCIKNTGNNFGKSTVIKGKAQIINVKSDMNKGDK